MPGWNRETLEKILIRIWNNDPGFTRVNLSGGCVYYFNFSSLPFTTNDSLILDGLDLANYYARNIGRREVAYLPRAWSASIVSDVSQRYVRFNRGDWLQKLAIALERNVMVTSVNLASNKIKYEKVAIVARLLRHSNTITRLDLSDNSIGSEGAKLLAAALRNNASLLTLKLKNCKICPSGVVALAEALETNNTLTGIDLSGNGQGEDGQDALARALKTNVTVTSVILSPGFLNMVGGGRSSFNRINQYLRRNCIPARLVKWQKTFNYLRTGVSPKTEQVIEELVQQLNEMQDHLETDGPEMMMRDLAVKLKVCRLNLLCFIGDFKQADELLELEYNDVNSQLYEEMLLSYVDGLNRLDVDNDKAMSYTKLSLLNTIESPKKHAVQRLRLQLYSELTGIGLAHDATVESIKSEHPERFSAVESVLKKVKDEPISWSCRYSKLDVLVILMAHKEKLESFQQGLGAIVSTMRKLVDLNDKLITRLDVQHVNVASEPVSSPESCDSKTNFNI